MSMYTQGKGDRKVVRDGVKDMRTFSLLLRVPSRKDSLEFLRDETTIIDFDGGPGDALGCDGVCQGGEGQLVGKESISPITEQPETLCDAIAVPESEGDQVIPRRMERVD